MTGRSFALAAAAASIVLLLGGAGATGAGASAAKPEIRLSTYVIVPGQPVTITGTGWPFGVSVDATVCGADAISGTADCTATAIATMVATAKGLLWSQITPALPPQPCPCVVLVTTTDHGYTETIPVKVTGAATEPVHPVAPGPTPVVRLSDLRVVGVATLASALGGTAPRTLELRVSNPGDRPVTPVLVGRWGDGRDLQNVIAMPVMRALGAGQSREVRASFALGALSVGAYRVRVQVQLVGYPRDIVVSSSTSQWPIALFACGLVLLVLIVFLAAAARRRTGRRQAEEAPEDRLGAGGPGQGDGSEPAR